MIPLGREAQASPIMSAARHLWLLLEVADLRGLPMPFAIRGTEIEGYPVALQFHSIDEVRRWADEIGARVEEGSWIHPGGTNDTASAIGTLLEVPIEVCASVPRAGS